MRSRNCPTCGVFVGHIKEHPCQAYRVEPELPPARTFPVIDDKAERLERYRKGLR